MDAHFRAHGRGVEDGRLRGDRRPSWLSADEATGRQARRPAACQGAGCPGLGSPPGVEQGDFLEGGPGARVDGVLQRRAFTAATPPRRRSSAVIEVMSENWTSPSVDCRETRADPVEAAQAPTGETSIISTIPTPLAGESLVLRLLREEPPAHRSRRARMSDGRFGPIPRRGSSRDPRHRARGRTGPAQEKHDALCGDYRCTSVRAAKRSLTVGRCRLEEY